MDDNLHAHQLKGAPPTVYYIPNFITEEEEKVLLNSVYKAPKPKWTVLSHRRLQNWGGLPGPKGMVTEDLPQWLSTYAKKIADLGAFEGNTPNHVLVNEYEAGQGIMPHEDGPAFFPTVSTISLGSHTLLDFYHHITSTQAGVQEHSQGGDVNTEDSSLASRHFASVLLEPRSLVLIKDDMYKVHLHGIKEVKEDEITAKVANLDCVASAKAGDILQRNTRVSLTIRYVPKVIKSKLIFGKR